MPDHRARLAAIKRFDQLVTYLRDDMGWPIEGDDFEEITFDYTPEELGIDAANRAKIQQIKRLRPLAANQPWGIFFVRFEPKRLPVVALRRILSRVVLKKRAAANSAERAAWDLADLLFISNYGDDAERRISFAHFVQDDDWGDLPTLKVLGWDGDDTNLHLDEVARKLTTKLRWPDDEADVPGWRATWGDAFTLRHWEVITTAKRLAERLADLARETRKKANAALAIESPTGPLRTLMDAFKKALIHDLDDDGFADMYAQTIAYGLLSARISRPAGLTPDNMAEMVPVTNPFLKEMLESFLRLGGRQRSGQGWTGIDFDELGINEIVQLLREANMEAVLRDFGDRNPQEDPVIHFYEHFLKEYDAKKRMQRGVFYTPRPVVSYIVRSVHELLQSKFGLADGLADTATWGEMLERHPGLKLPLLSDSPGETRTISPDEPFVQILDPATGTATFLVEVIDLVHQTMVAKWKAEGHCDKQIDALWNEYVPKYLLPRLHGFELMMAPYAIAHMKIGLRLHETGYRFGSEERVRIYLTNALEPWLKQLPLIGFEALAHEAAAVNEIKRSKRFTVIIGNPPYAGYSANNGEWIERLMKDYKNTVRIEERQIQRLSNDYVKFIRFGESVIGISNVGCLGFITDSGYLNGILFRDMRAALHSSFRCAWILNLHGVAMRGADRYVGIDENVFEITQGVAIALFARYHVNALNYNYADLIGSRLTKYAGLSESSASTTPWSALKPSHPKWFFLPTSSDEDYEGWPLFTEIIGTGSPKSDRDTRYGTGIKTRHDGFVVGWTPMDAVSRVTQIANRKETDSALIKELGLCTTAHFSIRDARRRSEEPELLTHVKPLTYRPFDRRSVVYLREFICEPKAETMRHMLNPHNLAMAVLRRDRKENGAGFFVSRGLIAKDLVSNLDDALVWPLYLLPDENQLLGKQAGEQVGAANIARKAVTIVTTGLGLKWCEHGCGDLAYTVGPEDIFRYVYAVCHSPGYRIRYAEFLKIDFPRLPLTGDLDIFRALTQLGGELVALHLLESPNLDQPLTALIGTRNPEVQKPAWSQDTVWVDNRQTTGFQGVPEVVWNFHIGGYQVCHKWLKDRKGRILSDEDIAHYHKIVVALNETIRLMQEIDAVIDQHGGWPGAFVLNSGEQA